MSGGYAILYKAGFARTTMLLCRPLLKRVRRATRRNGNRLKKMSKHARSYLINALIILGTLGIVLYLGSRDGGLGKAWKAMRSADWRWVLAAFGCWCLFTVLESLGLMAFFRFQKIRLKFGASVLVSLIGLFYSGVTPAATGGQPMQVIALKKRGISAGVSSSALVVKFFVYQLATLFLTSLLWALHPGIVSEYVNRVTFWLIVLGYVVNGISVAAVLLVAINKNVVRGIISLFIRIGKKLRLVKHEEKLYARADQAMEDFNTSVNMIKHHPDQLVRLFLLACAQVLMLMSITYCVYRAVGLRELDYLEVTTLQHLLYIAVAFTPLPGSSGAQETGFELIFSRIFGESALGAQLMWRFFTYYVTLIIGMGAVIMNSAGSIRRAREEAEQAMEEVRAKLTRVRRAPADPTEDDGEEADGSTEEKP